MLKKLKKSIKQRRAKYSNPRYWLSNNIFPLCANDKKLISYKNLHSGKRCFIIGNGPSLNKINLKLLKDEYTFGMNAIYINYENMGFYPNYYAVEDVFVAEDRCNEINSYSKSIKFFPNYLKYCLNKDEQTIFINLITNQSLKDFPRFSTNVASKVYFGGTVSYVCMQLAYYMGFTAIYLVGFDHNYTIPQTAQISGTGILSMDDDTNHFSKDYFGKGKRWHDPNRDRMEKAYNTADKMFKAAGRKIYNATAGGKLEVFERIDYNSLFN